MTEELVLALAAFAAQPHVVVALDFDGTLAELADDPQSVAVLPLSARALAALARDDGVRLALVSGRPTAELGRLASPPPGTILVGSHGSERAAVDGAGHPTAADVGLTEGERVLLGDLSAALQGVAAAIPGAWVEHKPVAAVLHTRLSGSADAAAAARLVLGGPATWPGVRAMQGKDVVELSVRSLTKGDAVADLRSGVGDGGPAPVLYAGDDVTDEHAFAVLGDGDLGIKVGEGETAAAYRVAGPEELGHLLAALVRLRP